jgi:DNA-binding transcriptional LysR family regulator
LEVIAQMKITLAQLRLLLTAVQMRSIGAAARESGLTQSATSQAIIALERALGVKLATRTRDGIVPTAFAQAILRDAEIASEAVRRIESLARARVAEPNRSLRVASVPSVASRLLPQWSKRFRRLYPTVELSIFEGSHLEVGEWVKHGVADIGLAAVAPAGLSTERIQNEELVVVARQGHPVLRNAAVDLEDLCRATLVTAGLGCEPIIKNLFESIGRPVPRVIPAQDIATALKMVRQGIGLTILPDTAFPRPGMVDLRIRCLSPQAHRPLYMVALPENDPADHVRRFREIVMAGATPPGISGAYASYRKNP